MDNKPRLTGIHNSIVLKNTAVLSGVRWSKLRSADSGVSRNSEMGCHGGREINKQGRRSNEPIEANYLRGTYTWRNSSVLLFKYRYFSHKD